MSEEPAVMSYAPQDAGFKRPVSRRRATLWNAVFSYGWLLMVFVRNLALVPLYLRFISNTEFGGWTATGGVLGYIMSDFGVLAVLGQQSAAAYGGGDRVRLQRLVGTGLAITLILSVIVTLIGSAICPFIPGWVHLGGEEATRLKHALLIVALSNGLNLLVMAFQIVLRSLQRPFVPGLMRVGAEAAGLGLTAWLVWIGWGLYGIAAGLAFRTAAMLAGTVLCFGWVWYHELSLHLHWAWDEIAGLWRLSASQFLTSLANLLRTDIDKLIVGVIMGPAIALVYTLTVRAHDMVRMLVDYLGISTIPSLSHLHGEQRSERFGQIVLVLARVLITCAVGGMIGVLVFNRWFMTLWVGADQFGGMSLTAIMCVYGVLYFVWHIIYISLQAMGEFPKMSRLVWIELGLRIPLAVLLIWAFGLVGAPVAAVVAITAGILWGFRRVFGELLRLDRGELGRVAGDLLSVAAAPIVAGLIFWRLPKAAGWLGFTFEVAGFVVVSAALIAVLKPALMRNLLKRTPIAAGA